MKNKVIVCYTPT